MQLDTTLKQTREIISKTKKSIWFDNRWNPDQSRWWIRIYLNCNRTHRIMILDRIFRNKYDYRWNFYTIFSRKHPISTNGATWYPQAWFLKLKHRIHTSYKKGIIERTIHNILKIEQSFDDYFPCRKERRIYNM